MRRLPAILSVCLLAAACRGRPLPEPVDLTLPRASTGARFSFAAQRGKVVLVYFFTTWCIPCQAMEPAVAKAAVEGADEGIEVVGVALDLDAARIVGAYVRATAPPYPVLLGGHEVVRGESPFGRIPELPAVLYLDREGRPSASISGVAGPDLLLDRARDVQSR